MEKKQIHWETLGFITNSDKEEKYRDFLNEAFDSDEMKNIAITGPKGAGKSSVLRTYLHERSVSGNEINTINITVGCYENIDIKASNNISGEQSEGNNVCCDSYTTEQHIKEQQIESKILNQIINQIPPVKIPESIFHIDRNHKWSKSIFRAVIAAVAFMCIMYLFIGIRLNAILNTSEVTGEVMYDLWSVPNICMCVISAIILAVGVVMILKNYSYKRLPKLTINDCSIAPAENNDTIFNKYIDEILYMLINSDCDAVIFEDLERLNDKSIFGKLREINFVLNERIKCNNKVVADRIAKHKKNCIGKIIFKLNDRLAEKKKRSYIKFVYVTSDSLFSGKNRVKFFDTIIPIVPVVDKSNSLEIVNRKAKERSIDIDKDFLGSINMFIDDMRIITNIFNELLVYKSQLDKTGNNINASGLNNTVMFAFLLYKNTMPDDYEKFQYHEGIVYSILKGINKIKKDALSENIYDNEQIIYSSPNEYFSMIGRNFDDEYGKICSDVSGIATLDKNHRELINYLIRYGYITIEESEYSSYFYADNLTDDERAYILAVKQNKQMDASLKLEHISDILSNLKGYEDSVGMLNNYLVKYVVDNIELHREKIFKTIISHRKVDFVNEFVKFLEKTQERSILKKFIIGLNRLWNDIFTTMKKECDYESYKRYAELSMLYCNKDTIVSMNIEECLTNLFNDAERIKGA